MTEIFNTLLVTPIINTLVAIYKLLSIFGVPFAFGLSIILLTALIRIIIYPLTTSQLRSMKKMQELKPQLDRIKERFKNDRSRQQQETMLLYRQHGVNPAAGCLPLLIQFPILIALYSVFFFHVVKEDTAAVIENINKILYFEPLRLESAWDTNFFGVSLVATPLKSWTTEPILILIPIITAVLQFVQSKTMTPQTQKTQGQTDDFQKIMQTQMVYFFPLMIGIFAFTLPVGLSLYWNTFTVFGIIQQILFARNVKS